MICCWGILKPMAWIVKTPNRKYKVVERFPRGCRVRTVPTLELARQLQRRMEEQRKAQELGLSTSENLPLVEALEKYVAYRQTDLPPNSIRPEASRLKRLSAFWEEHGCAFVYDITPELLQRFKVRRLGEGAAKNTVNHEITLAKAFLNWLVKMRIVEHNPIAHVEKVRIPEQQRAILSPDQARKVLATLEQKGRHDGERYPLQDCVPGPVCWMRREGAVQLKWTDLDFDERRLVISGKGASCGLSGQAGSFVTSSGAARTTAPWWLIPRGGKIP